MNEVSFLSRRVETQRYRNRRLQGLKPPRFGGVG